MTLHFDRTIETEQDILAEIDAEELPFDEGGGLDELAEHARGRPRLEAVEPMRFSAA